MDESPEFGRANLRFDAAQSAPVIASAFFVTGIPPLTEYIDDDRDAMLWHAEETLIAAGAVEVGDLIVLTVGDSIGGAGGTNTMKLVRVGEYRRLPPKPDI